MAAHADNRNERHADAFDGERRGLRLSPGYLDRDGQADLLAAVRGVLEAAPLFVPRMPRSGRPFAVRMSNCGTLGWVSDESGYRYQRAHPDTDRPWPPFPPALLAIWRELSQYPFPPEACLINFYGLGAKMGLHQDRDENDLTPRWFRFRSVIPACFGSAARGGTSRPGRFGSTRVMLSFSAALRGSPFTAWIGFIRAHRACSRTGDGSI
jgi:DNA oxidative demethylase